MPNYVLTFVAALIVSLAVTPLVMKLAEVTGAMDAPDARKVHKKPIPRIGGIGIFTAFMISFIALTDFDALVPEVSRGLMGLLIGASIIVLVGIIDDYKNLPAKVKLFGQIGAAAVAVILFDVRIEFITDPFGDYFYTEFAAIPIAIFWIVGLTNTVNLIDWLPSLSLWWQCRIR